MMLESAIEDSVRKWALSHRWVVIKFTPKGERGWMDRIFINRNGIHVWIEFKKPGEEPEPIQYFRIKQLRRQSCYVHWFDNVADAKICLTYYDLGEHDESPFLCCSNSIRDLECKCRSPLPVPERP